MIAEVIINSTVKSLNRIFDYHIPEKLQSEIYVGSRIIVPFGRTKNSCEGFVIGLKEKSEYEVKDIIGIQREELSEEKMQLAKWMAKRYFCNVSECIKMMLPPGTTTKKESNRIREKKISCVYLKREIEDIQYEIENQRIKSPKQIRVLRFLIENEGATIQDIEMFADTTRAVVKTLEKNGYVEVIEQTIDRNPFLNRDVEKTEKLLLTEEQQNAYLEVEQAIQEKQFKSFLLYGITGSGKTEIYLQLIEKVLKENKSAIVLVPEISLTPQMVNRFIARFGTDTIGVLHSKLSVGERYDAWKRIEKGECKIVIGARSAIFAPIQNLGIIIIDEEHDNSYKSEMSPRYQAKEVATRIAREQKVPLVLGSATPDITTFYKAQNAEIKLLTLSKRANHSQLPKMEIVDLRQELANGNRSMISNVLYQAIEKNIERKRQTILFLNRRGFSTFLMCRDCGHVLKCKNCNISLTYHKKEEKLKCHYCGHQEEVVKICPECGSEKIRYFGTGTQRLEQEINRLFPKATTIRMDIDTVTKKNSHEDILNQFQKENIDILIGTQMVVKGHHFPKVTLVGVVAADSSLNMDDYRAEERTFDLIVQVAGRAGREKEEGKVIVQTYNPDSYSIQYAKKQDYLPFYATEINLRKQLKYPPFCDIIMIGISGEKEKDVKQSAECIYRELENAKMMANIQINIMKPLPAPVDKIKNRYRWRIIIKTIMTEKVNEVINQTMSKYYQNTRGKTRVVIDCNPTNMM